MHGGVFAFWGGEAGDGEGGFVWAASWGAGRGDFDDEGYVGLFLGVLFVVVATLQPSSP